MEQKFPQIIKKKTWDEEKDWNDRANKNKLQDEIFKYIHGLNVPIKRHWLSDWLKKQHCTEEILLYKRN